MTQAQWLAEHRGVILTSLEDIVTSVRETESRTRRALALAETLRMVAYFANLDGIAITPPEHLSDSDWAPRGL